MLFCVFWRVLAFRAQQSLGPLWVVNGQMSGSASTHSRHIDALEPRAHGARECNLFKHGMLMLSFGMARASAPH